MGKATNQQIEVALQVNTSPTRREQDKQQTCGEREAKALVLMACVEQGREAISFTGSQAGILPNDRHSGARIVEVRPFRIEDELDRGKVVIVAGFQGVSYEREVAAVTGQSQLIRIRIAGGAGGAAVEHCLQILETASIPLTHLDLEGQ